MILDNASGKFSRKSNHMNNLIRIYNDEKTKTIEFNYSMNVKTYAQRKKDLLMMARKRQEDSGEASRLINYVKGPKSRAVVSSFSK